MGRSFHSLSLTCILMQQCASALRLAQHGGGSAMLVCDGSWCPTGTDSAQDRADSGIWPEADDDGDVVNQRNPIFEETVTNRAQFKYCHSEDSCIPFNFMTVLKNRATDDSGANNKLTGKRCYWITTPDGSGLRHMGFMYYWSWNLVHVRIKIFKLMDGSGGYLAWPSASTKFCEGEASSSPLAWSGDLHDGGLTQLNTNQNTIVIHGFQVGNDADRWLKGSSGNRVYWTEKDGVSSVTGDPHVVDMAGNKFDILALGTFSFLRLETRVFIPISVFAVDGVINRVSSMCSKSFIEGLHFTGMWMKELSSLHTLNIRAAAGKDFAEALEIYSEDVWEPASTIKNGSHIFGHAAQVKIFAGSLSVVVDLHEHWGWHYLDFGIRGLKALDQSNIKIGGLLAFDDKTEASTAPSDCSSFAAGTDTRPEFLSSISIWDSNLNNLKNLESVSQTWCLQFPYCPTGCSLWCVPEAPVVPPSPLAVGNSRQRRKSWHKSSHKSRSHRRRRRKVIVDLLAVKSSMKLVLGGGAAITTAQVKNLNDNPAFRLNVKKELAGLLGISEGDAEKRISQLLLTLGATSFQLLQTGVAASVLDCKYIITAVTATLQAEIKAKLTTGDTTCITTNLGVKIKAEIVKAVAAFNEKNPTAQITLTADDVASVTAGVVKEVECAGSEEC